MRRLYHTARIAARIAAAAATILAPIGEAQAQARRAAVSVGTLTSEGNCKLYRATSGRRSVYADPWVYASTTSWTTWFYRDCQNHFAGIRNALEAALASSGKLTVGGGGYSVSGRISGVSGEGGPAPGTPAPGQGEFAVSSSSMMVEFDVSLRDRSGRIVYGTLVSKKLETGSNVATSDFRATSSMSGEAAYALLQREAALAVARKIAFHIEPMRVTALQGNKIQLSYGSPFLTMGMLVDVTAPGGGAVVRYRVTSASGGSSLAEPYSDGDRSQIVPGSEAVAIESDSPEANGRRFEKVELP